MDYGHCVRHSNSVTRQSLLFARERGVRPVGVVDVFDEGADAGARVLEIGVGLAVDFLGLQGLHETPGLGVVVKVARSIEHWKRSASSLAAYSPEAYWTRLELFVERP
jgi:hypothetical protein